MNSKLNLEVQLGNLKLKNPIMPASGTFGYEMMPIIDFNKLGAIVPKSITKYPRGGNKTPRVSEVNAGMINSIGIQSQGIDYYIHEILPKYSNVDSPIIASISADSVEEFVEMTEILASLDNVAAIELNISCPNLENDGQAFGMDSEISYELVSKARKVTSKCIIPKLTPNVTKIQDIATACEEAGADALNVANTLLAMSIDIHTKKPKIGNVMGGLSGPSIKPVIVRMIYQVSNVTNIPIICCGGVMNGEDAIEMIIAGASAVQVGTANFINSNSMINIIEEIEMYMIKYGIDDINDLVGQVKIGFDATIV